MMENENFDEKEFNHFDDVAEEINNSPEDYTVSGGTRFVNYIIDMVIFYAIIFVPEFAGFSIITTNTLFIYVIMFLYYSITEGLFGASIGKLITGCVVVDKNGNKVSSTKAMGRSLCRFIPFEAFSFLGNRARGWHDTITDTYVVKKNFLDK